MYDEQADLALHRREVETLRDALRAFGAPDTGYGLGVDVGGGYGLHAPQLLEMCQRLYIADLTDYVHAFGGVVGKALADKFERNGLAFDRARVEYHHVDAQAMIYRDGLFDIAFSINAFEHIAEPAAALAEMIRVTKPGGIVILQFDPLWNSALGHHLPHLGFAPWQHLIEGDAAFEASIRAAGGGDPEVNAYRTAMNRRPFSDYREMFRRLPKDAFERVHLEWWATDPQGEPQSQHPNFAAAVAAGFPPSELFVRGMRFVGRRAARRRGFFARG